MVVTAGPHHRAALGATVRQLRTARGLTLRELAGVMAVSPATLSAIENGKTGMSSERVVQVAAAFDVPVQRVYAGSSDLTRDAKAGGDRTTRAPMQETDRRDWRTFSPLVLDPALGGALAMFLEFGYHGATVRVIAEAANLSVPGLYHHYSSKQEMLVALLDLTMSDLLSRAEAARGDGADAVDRFALLVECLALFHTQRRELAFVGSSEMRSLTSASRHRVAAMRRHQQRLVDVEVQDAARSGAFRTTRPLEASRAVVTMCTALAQWFRRDGPASAETVAAQNVDFALALVRCEMSR